MKSNLFKFFISKTLKNNPGSRGNKRKFQAPQVGLLQGSAHNPLFKLSGLGKQPTPKLIHKVSQMSLDFVQFRLSWQHISFFSGFKTCRVKHQIQPAIVQTIAQHEVKKFHSNHHVMCKMWPPAHEALLLREDLGYCLRFLFWNQVLSYEFLFNCYALLLACLIV